MLNLSMLSFSRLTMFTIFLFYVSPHSNTMLLSALISDTTQILLLKLGINGADEPIPTVPNVPFSGLISVFDIILALIVTVLSIVLFPEIETILGLLMVHYWKVFISVRRSVPMRATPCGNVFIHNIVSHF